MSACVAFIGADKHPKFELLVDALREIEQDHRDYDCQELVIPKMPTPVTSTLSPGDAYFGNHEILAAADAIGRVSADSLAAYPPGVPNVLPGEPITEELVHLLQTTAASPIGYVHGTIDTRHT